MNWDTINIILYFIINLFDLWVILRYFGRLLEASRKKKLFLYGMYFCFLLFFTVLIRYELEYSNIVSLALWSCMFLPTYKGERKNKLVYAILLLGFGGFSQTIMYFIINNNSYTVYSYFIPHFIFFLITEIGGRFQTVKGRDIDTKLLLILISVPLMSLIAMPCVALLIEQIHHISLNEGTSMLIPIAILILYVNIIVFYLYDEIKSVLDVRKQKDEYEQQLKWQQAYYDSLAENQNIIKKIKHDLQNNLQSMDKLVQEGKTKEMVEYLKELIMEQEEIQNIIATGNAGIDTILNIKLSMAQRYGIEVKRNISIPTDLPMPYGHCIRIFGNLLDNAINAVKDEMDISKTICLFLSFQANAFIIQVSNPYRDKPIKDDKDNFFHGLGIDIVKTTAELYNGSFEVEDDGEIFTVNIILYMEI